MMDYCGLEHDIAFVKGIIAAANTKITEIESTAKQIKSELDMIKTDKPASPAWNPEDLIGKLVRAWEDGGCTTDGILSTIDTENEPKQYCYYVSGNYMEHIRPLTEAEALALVWRLKPKTRYDWSKAPKWARCAGIDKNGEAHWYNDIFEDMYFDDEEWLVHVDKYIKMGDDCILDASGDWRDSLERRPS